MPYSHPVRIYYEDTDLAGIVYYANYLKFIERGRSEWVASLGIDQMALREVEGVVFAVRRVEADYLRPARFGDDLLVVTDLEQMTGARIVLRQNVLREDLLLFQATVTLVCLTKEGQAARIPDSIRAKMIA